MQPTHESNHYEVLGIDARSTRGEIKEAFRRMSFQTHPDQGGSAALFRLVQEAWDVLGDESARADYDRRRGAPGHPGPAPAGANDRPGSSTTSDRPGPSSPGDRAREDPPVDDPDEGKGQTQEEPSPRRSTFRGSQEPWRWVGSTPPEPPATSARPAGVWAAPVVIAFYGAVWMGFKTAEGNVSGGLETLFWAPVGLVLSLVFLTAWIAVPVSIVLSVMGLAERRPSARDHSFGPGEDPAP